MTHRRWFELPSCVTPAQRDRSGSAEGGWAAAEVVERPDVRARRGRVDSGRRPGVTSEESAEIRRLKRENAVVVSGPEDTDGLACTDAAQVLEGWWCAQLPSEYEFAEDEDLREMLAPFSPTVSRPGAGRGE